jgi:hypothetical protein
MSTEKLAKAQGYIFNYRGSIVNKRNSPYKPGEVTGKLYYCGRGSVMGNPFTHRTDLSKNLIVVSTVDEAVNCYSRFIIGIINKCFAQDKLDAKETELIRFLANLNSNDTLECWCWGMHNCHCTSIWKAWQYFHFLKSGEMKPK